MLIYTITTQLKQNRLTMDGLGQTSEEHGD